MTSYFFDTNILFKVFFNRQYFTECELKDYFNNDSPKFISRNVDYEFLNIFLEFSNQLNQFLLEPYFQLTETKHNITLKQYQKLTKDIEILRFNNKNISSMIWNIVTNNNNQMPVKVFKNELKKFIFNFNSYFHSKYADLINHVEIHNRLDKYDEIAKKLNPHIHQADLKICLDAHDIAVKNNIDDLVLVSADKIFHNNYEMIIGNTKINDIILIK